MPSISISNASWTLIASPAADSLVVSCSGRYPVEYAISAANTPPVTGGHVLPANSLLTRAIVGYNYLWARVPEGDAANTAAVLVVTTGNPPPAGAAVEITGPVTVANSVEVQNDTGNPIPTRDVGGASAATITTDTVAVSGTFSALTVISDAVFTSLTRANTTGSLGSVAVPAGVTLFGVITGYQLASGAVIAYGA